MVSRKLQDLCVCSWHRRPLDQIAGFSNKSFLFRDVACVYGPWRIACWLKATSLEIFFKDSRTLLSIFLNGVQRHDVSQRMQAIITRHSTHENVSILGLATREMNRAMLIGRGRAASITHDMTLATAQRQWQNREISNVGGQVLSFVFPA